MREQLNAGPRTLLWKIQFHAEPAKRRRWSWRSNNSRRAWNRTSRTPMLIGYLDNPEWKYLIGQFVTATILEPPPDTVEVPTDAINPLNGQEFVFVEDPEAKNQFPDPPRLGGAELEEDVLCAAETDGRSRNRRTST